MLLNMTLRWGQWQHIKEGPTKAGVFLFHLWLWFLYRLGNLSHEQSSRVLHQRGNERKKKQSIARWIRRTRTPVKLVGRLPNMVLQLWTWSILGWLCRQLCTQAHSYFKPQLSVLLNCPNSLIYVSTYASKKNVLHQHCATGLCLPLSFWLHYGT